MVFRSALIGLLVFVWTTAYGAPPCLDGEGQVRINGETQPWTRQLVGKRASVQSERRGKSARMGSSKSPTAALLRVDLSLRPLYGQSLAMPSIAVGSPVRRPNVIHARAPPVPA